MRSKRNSKVRKVVALVLAGATMVAGLTGCNNNQLVIHGAPFAVTAEVRDFYANEMEYTDLFRSQVITMEDTVELLDMSDDDIQMIQGKLAELYPKLQSPVYTADLYLSQQMHDNLKAVLQDKELNNGVITYSKRTRSMYIVDVTYELKPMDYAGNMKEDVKYLGLHGAYRRDPQTYAYELDSQYISYLMEAQAAKELREQQMIQAGLAAAEMGDTYSSDYVTYIDKQTVNYQMYNNVFGSAMSSVAQLPDLNMVFEEPAPVGQLSGVGIRAEGGNGINEFGIWRGDFRGDLTIRYIFRENPVNHAVTLDNMYVHNWRYTNGIPAIAEEDYDIFPQVTRDGIQEMLERGTRAIMNNDVSAMCNSHIFGNLRFAIENAWRNKSTRDTYRKDEITAFMKRKDNLYLIKVETDGCAEVRYAEKGEYTYKETSLVVLEQQDDEYTIVDWVTVARECIKEPELDFKENEDSRYSYILSGGVPSVTDKAAVRSYMQQQYESWTELDYDAIFASLNPNEQTLTYNQRRNLYFTILGTLDRAGLDEEGYRVAPDYMGVVTKWLGASGTPEVEIETLELCKLPSGLALELVRYYLISWEDTGWQISDVQTKSTTELSDPDQIAELEEDIRGYIKKAEEIDRATASEEDRQSNVAEQVEVAGNGNREKE